MLAHMPQSNVTKFSRRSFFMTGDSVDNDVTDAPKFKIDARPSATKRRLSRSHPVLENGDVESAMSPLNAAQNLNSYSKQICVATNTKDAHSQYQSDGNIPVGEMKSGNAEPKLSKEESQDARHWKELVLLHLDLIQQQREMLQTKDRQIKTLTQEKETLKQRLERMERRMSLVRQRTEASPSTPHRTPRSSATTAVGETNGSSTLSCRRGDGSVQRSQTKRKLSSLQPQSLNRKFAESSEKGSSSPCLRRRDAAETATNDDQMNRAAAASPRKEPKSMHADRLLRTPVLYYTASCCHGDSSDANDTFADAKKTDVPVPSWKYSYIPTGYQMEGTENLGNEIFAKRHQKPEADERRRKRWDMQRLRDERIAQKIGQGSGDTTCRRRTDSHMDDRLTTFTPDLDQVTHIHVADTIPVSAFGRQLPLLAKKEFSLPWDCEQPRHANEKSKSSRGKRR